MVLNNMGNNISTPPQTGSLVRKTVTHTPNAHAPTTHTHDKIMQDLNTSCTKDGTQDMCKFLGLPKK
jgi:hypothetical protein